MKAHGLSDDGSQAVPRKEKKPKLVHNDSHPVEGLYIRLSGLGGIEQTNLRQILEAHGVVLPEEAYD